MADTRIKDAPDAPSDLTGYYMAVDKDGQPSFEKVLIDPNFSKDTGYVLFEDFAAEVTTVAENQLIQKGHEVHGFLRVAIGVSISGGVLCKLPATVSPSTEDVLTYAVDHNNSGENQIVRLLTDGSVVFTSSLNDGQWYIKFDYSV